MQNLNKSFSISVGLKNIFSPPAAIHNMIPGSRIFYAQWSEHNKLSISQLTAKVKSGLDPFYNC
jgi:hypothetical protein